MPEPVRLFISHSADDAALTDAVAAGFAARTDWQVLLDRSGLEPGRPWRRELHEWMARCSAGLVLLTPAVLARAKWVLKETIILGWRFDLERDFRLMFALAPGLTRQAFLDQGFGLAQMAEAQFLATPAALPDAAALAAEVAALLPVAPPPSPYDALLRMLTELLQIADPQGATYRVIAQHLGITAPATYGPDKRAQLADEVARAIVRGRDDRLAIDELVNRLGAWDKEHRRKLTELLVPFWVDAQAAGLLLRQVPVGAAAGGPEALVIDGELVPEFTAEMYVRRAYAQRQSGYRLAAAVALQDGDLYGEIRHELCVQARAERWALAGLKDDAVVAKLRASPSPIFVPLVTLPDGATLERLRSDFPRVVFVAPRPVGGVAAGARELLPPPPKDREAAEYQGFDGAMNAIRNL